MTDRVVSNEEKAAIELHKWYLSESEGYDVGWEAALSDWKMYHQEKWRNERRSKLLSESAQEMKEIGEYTEKEFDRKDTEVRREGEKQWVEKYAAEWRKKSVKIRPSESEIKQFKEESGLHIAKYVIPEKAEMKEIEITSPLGLHVRPSMKIKVVIDDHPGAKVFVRNLSTHSPVIEIRDLCNILALGAICSDKLLFGVYGENAAEVLDEIEKVLKEDLSE